MPQTAAPPADRRTVEADQARAEVGGRRFAFTGHVFFDELDAMGMLHNSRYAVLAERANSAFFEANGWRFEADPALNPDQFYVVREQSFHYLDPIRGPGDIAVDMWVESLGRSSVTYAFQIRSGDRARVHAEVRRTQVKLDLQTLRPTAWSAPFRALIESLLLPAKS